MPARAYTTLRTMTSHGEWHLVLIPITTMAPPATTADVYVEPVLKPAVALKPLAVASPPSLQQFIKASGGLNPDYNAGQWKHELAMIRDGGNLGLIPGVLRKASSLTFEEMAQSCVDAGYITEPDVDLMLWALSKDVEATGSKEQWNRVYGHTGEDFSSDLAYSRWLESLPEEDELLAA
jgi:hypothetical protein